MIHLALTIASALFLLFVGAVALYLVFAVMAAAVAGTAYAAGGFFGHANRVADNLVNGVIRFFRTATWSRRRRRMLREQEQRLAAQRS